MKHGKKVVCDSKQKKHNTPHAKRHFFKKEENKKILFFSGNFSPLTSHSNQTKTKYNEKA
jgi:hypothetical protein